MEHLLALYNRIHQLSPPPVFTKEVIIVQNAGMQHWLNMSLAQTRGISLAVDYALPAQYLWKLVRSLAEQGVDSEQNPFSREALCWRIFALLATDTVINHDKFSQVTQYWLTPDQQKAKLGEYSQQEDLKRYQLSCQLADLFEQYLVFRPDWIDCWHNRQTVIDSQQQQQFSQLQSWQAILWQMLTSEQEYNPAALVNSAIAHLPLKPQLLPKRISFFGLNAMPPMWLSFINRLSEYCDVHFFHLNPCFSYWGDVLTEKQAIKACTAWTANVEDIAKTVGNPLLANLGQQGREFLSLIQDYSTFDIAAFDRVDKGMSLEKLSVLEALQQDILTLQDRRTNSLVKKDDSVVITSAHSALREVQGLHDWLLHQFNHHPDLTPKDILVMCPQVEQYAPYVNAVFTRGWQEVDKSIPPLPCSIADRISKDSEPLVAAFTELISLPDSRFQVSQIQAWLRIPVIAQKFSLTDTEIERCFIWVERACIHWGLNAEHKNQQLHSQKNSAQFTWQYGLSRLLQGFAQADHITLADNKVLLPVIEGDDGVLLGKFMLVLEQLEFYRHLLTLSRTPLQWHSFLVQLIADFFISSDDGGIHIITHAVDLLVEYCQQANFQQKINLTIVQDFLNNHFSQPQPSRQFMIGQVTFCSMLPMRSIPFKIVAILGLNDGEYPRQRQPLGFDLMSLSTARLGDRSRRGDDRYLFLEAIISARQHLYLSFQGRSIKNNNQRQPSIVLKELMDYLSMAYGWQLTDDNHQDIRQLAMQAFSAHNYQGKFPSFDEKWLAIIANNTGIKPDEPASEITQIIPFSSENSVLAASDQAAINNPILSLNASELISFFQHSARCFARQRLDLHLDSEHKFLSDTEPFDCDHLASYQLKTSLVDNELNSQQSSPTTSDLLKQAQLGGYFPDLPTTPSMLQKLRDDSDLLIEYIRNEQADNTEIQPLALTIELPIKQQTVTLELTATVSIVNNKIVFYRVSSAKPKDFFTLYLHQLIIQVWQQQTINAEQKQSLQPLYTQFAAIEATHGYYFDTKTQKISHFCYQQIEQPQVLLTNLIETFVNGQHQPLLLSADLADKLLNSKSFTQDDFEKFWCIADLLPAFGEDQYIKYFWPSCPLLSSVAPLITELYTPVYQYQQKLSP